MNSSAVLKEASDKAIERGNRFEGFMGLSPEDFSKEELVMLCNVLYDAMQQFKIANQNYLRPGYLESLRSH